VPAGYAYVPPGCFFFGDTDFEALRKFFRSPPRHRVCMSAGYLIGHAEVTIQDWLRYLDDLPPGAPPRHLFEQVHRDAWGGIRLRQVASQWEFAFFRAENSEPELRARAGQLVRYPHRPRLHAEQDWRRFPMVGVSVEDIQGYLAWLDHSGRLPGARLCNEHEWERAARGADDRLYPHGDVLTGADANYLEAHGGSIWKNYGLDEVGAHPASVSPFGLVDMSGNAWELVQPIAIEPAAVTIRGGSYYYQADILRVTLRQESQPNQRDVTIGFRVCAPPGAP
jgi:formylglycine-generating enzyme required for sulfatase activity